MINELHYTLLIFAYTILNAFTSQIHSNETKLYVLFYELNILFGICFIFYSCDNSNINNNNLFYKFCHKLTIYNSFIVSQVLVSLHRNGENQLRDLVIRKSLHVTLSRDFRDFDK